MFFGDTTGDTLGRASVSVWCPQSRADARRRRCEGYQVLANVTFDAVSMHPDDFARMSAALVESVTADHVLNARAQWWA